MGPQGGGRLPSHSIRLTFNLSDISKIKQKRLGSPASLSGHSSPRRLVAGRFQLRRAIKTAKRSLVSLKWPGLEQIGDDATCRVSTTRSRRDKMKRQPSRLTAAARGATCESRRLSTDVNSQQPERPSSNNRTLDDDGGDAPVDSVCFSRAEQKRYRHVRAFK